MLIRPSPKLPPFTSRLSELPILLQHLPGYPPQAVLQAACLQFSLYTLAALPALALHINSLACSGFGV